MLYCTGNYPQYVYIYYDLTNIFRLGCLSFIWSARLVPRDFFGLKIGSALEFAVPSRFDVFPLFQKIRSALRFAVLLDLDVGSRLLKQQFNLSLSTQALSRCGVFRHGLNLLRSIVIFVGFVFVNRVWNFLTLCNRIRVIYRFYYFTLLKFVVETLMLLVSQVADVETSGSLHAVLAALGSQSANALVTQNRVICHMC